LPVSVTKRRFEPYPRGHPQGVPLRLRLPGYPWVPLRFVPGYQTALIVDDRHSSIRIVAIARPHQWVVADVVAYFFQFIFIANDMLVKIAVPELSDEGGPSLFAHAADVLICGDGFESPNHFAERRGTPCG
jgi:hypothetical protein